VEAGDLAGECGLRELVRALLEEEEDEEREAERERGRGKISGGRFGLGARVFDDEYGQHVATALTRRRRCPTHGRAELPVWFGPGCYNVALSLHARPVLSISGKLRAGDRSIRH